MSVAGFFIPPMFVYPGARMSAGLRRGGPPGSVYKMSKSGWINEDLFVEWLVHFVQHTNSSPDNRTLLLLDNHTSHTSLAAYEFCKENGITVLSFPPHTSHRLQPLDVSFFGPLKRAYNSECALFMRNNPYEKIEREDIPKIFKSAYEKVAGVGKAVSGFEKTGIFPLNPDVFSDFIPASEIASKGLNVDETVGGENCSGSGYLLVDDEDKVPEDIHEDCRGAVPSDPAKAHSSKSAFGANQVFTGDTSNVTEEIEVGCSGSVTFAQISPLPVKASSSAEAKPKYRPKQHSEILTATPRKKFLEDRDGKRKKKLFKMSETKRQKVQQKKKTVEFKPREICLKGRKRKLFQDDSSSSEDGDRMNEKQLVSDSDDELFPQDVSGLPELNNTNDVCLFCGEFGRNNELWYRCVICSGWVHSECSAAESAHNFKCDYCLNKQ